MATDIKRSPLTSAVLTLLRATGCAIGDGEMPDASWIGQPNAPGSEYEPFAVLSELTADRSDGSLADDQGDWRMPYMVELFGVARDQVSLLADDLRNVLAAMRNTVITLGASTYKVQQVRNDSIGQPQQIRVVNPPFWHQQDGITLWMGRQLS